MSPTPTIKAVILVGGPQKGTRFRPLSLERPKPLFPVAGLPLIKHHIEALASRVPGLREILVLGSFARAEMEELAREASAEHKVRVAFSKISVN